MAEPYTLLHQLLTYNASDVPGELLDLVAAATLALDLPSALRLLQASTALRGRLAAVRAGWNWPSPCAGVSPVGTRVSRW